MPKTNTRNPSTNELIGAIAQTLLNDMAASANLQVELAKSIGYNRGFDTGYEAGWNAAVANANQTYKRLQYAIGALEVERAD